MGFRLQGLNQRLAGFFETQQPIWHFGRGRFSRLLRLRTFCRFLRLLGVLCGH